MRSVLRNTCYDHRATGELGQYERWHSPWNCQLERRLLSWQLACLTKSTNSNTQGKPTFSCTGYFTTVQTQTQLRQLARATEALRPKQHDKRIGPTTTRKESCIRSARDPTRNLSDGVAVHGRSLEAPTTRDNYSRLRAHTAEMPLTTGHLGRTECSCCSSGRASVG